MSYRSKIEMTTPIVFLDFDGVLTNIESRITRKPDEIAKGIIISGAGGIPLWQTEMDLTSLKLLNLLCEITSAKIVLSTSWRRKLRLVEINSWFRHDLKLEHLDVIDVTQPFVTLPSGDQGIRGDEIEQWLVSHPHESYLILDDELHFRKAQYARAVICEHNVGFRFDQFISALKILEVDQDKIDFYLAEAANPRWINHPIGTVFE